MRGILRFHSYKSPQIKPEKHAAITPNQKPLNDNENPNNNAAVKTAKKGLI